MKCIQLVKSNYLPIDKTKVHMLCALLGTCKVVAVLTVAIAQAISEVLNNRKVVLDICNFCQLLVLMPFWSLCNHSLKTCKIHAYVCYKSGPDSENRSIKTRPLLQPTITVDPLIIQARTRCSWGNQSIGLPSSTIHSPYPSIP
jgi:hypothetical protein